MLALTTSFFITGPNPFLRLLVPLTLSSSALLLYAGIAGSGVICVWVWTLQEERVPPEER